MSPATLEMTEIFKVYVKNELSSGSLPQIVHCIAMLIPSELQFDSCHLQVEK